MPTTHASPREPHHTPGFSAPPTLRHPRQDLQAIDETARAALEAFTVLGGCICADELASRLSHTGANGVGTVARWLVARQVVVVHTAVGYWLPRFQFIQPAWALAGVVPCVLRDLASVMSDAEIAEWFYTANAWLQGRTPAGALRDVPAEVGHAARVQRFLIAL